MVAVVTIIFLRRKLMIFLDANAFYWYFGRENLFVKSTSIPKHDVKKLNKYLDTIGDKYLPASVFMEIIVHFRDEPDKIMNIIKFLENKSIKIFNNLTDHCFTPDEFTFLYITENNTALAEYAYKLLDKKISIEVKHTYIFLQIVSLLYSDYYLKSNTSLNSETKENILSFLGRGVFIEMYDDLRSQLTASLKIGYKNNRSQQALKEKYIELLLQNCIISQMIIDATVKLLENENDLYSVMRKSAINARNNGFTDDRIMNTIKSALNIDSAFLRLAEDEISDIFLRKGYTKHQADYFKTMLKAWLERGQKLIKNDIFDMLCVGALDKVVINPAENILIDQNSYLISFDEAMVCFLCNNKGNVRLLNKFLLPQYQLTS